MRLACTRDKPDRPNQGRTFIDRAGLICDRASGPALQRRSVNITCSVNMTRPPRSTPVTKRVRGESIREKKPANGFLLSLMECISVTAVIP